MNDAVLHVKQTVCKQKLLTPGDSVLVALSGGADSVCLLFILLELADEFSLSVSAAHLHHGLRGEEADHDEEFVRDLCNRLSVPLYVEHRNVRELAMQEKISLETAGRKARYAFFDSLSQKHHFSKIATAHHENDNVETVLMRILRGTGPAGLGGIPYQKGNIIRPMLDLTRQEIEGFLTAKQLSWCTDSTNGETDFTRNRIRNELIPMLEEKYNPNFQRGFGEQIRLYASAAAYIEEETNHMMAEMLLKCESGVSFSCYILRGKPEILVRTMLHKILEQMADDKEIEGKHVEAVWQMLQSEKGCLSLPNGIIAEVAYGNLYIRRVAKSVSFNYCLEQTMRISECGIIINCQPVDFVPKNKECNTVYLDMTKIDGKPLFVRSRRAGDYFYPAGMTGKKKLQDYFVDQKVPKHLRDAVPLVTVSDEIAWVGGFRADQRYMAETGQTKALCIRIHREEQS